MTEAELGTYRQRLLELGKRLNDDMAQLAGEALRTSGGEASGNLSSTPIHMADLSADNFEEEVTLGLLQNEDHLADEIQAALRRLANGTFGRCEECRRDISQERLRALPYTRHCIDCARKLEAGNPS